MGSDSELKVVILLEDKASQGLKAVGSSLKDFGGVAGKVAAAGLAATAGGLLAVGGAAVSLARDAAPLQGIEDAFYGIASAAGVGGDKMIANLQDMSSGMITNRDLMESFNKASTLVSNDFAVQLPDAMGYLGKVAAATGQDMGFMMDSLVTGVGRMSPMILDNLGIQVSLAEAMDRAAEMAGKEASALSKTEQQAGLMAIVMEKLGTATENMPDVTGSAEQAFASFEVAIQNTKDAIGQALLPVLTPLMSGLGELAAKALPWVMEKIEPLIEKVNNLASIFSATKDPIEGLKWVLMDIFGPEIAQQFDLISEKFMAIKDTIMEFVNTTLIPFIQEHWEQLKAGLIAVGAILAGAAIVGGILSIVAAIVALFNPITLVIVAIGLLATAWATNWGGIQEKTQAVVKWLTEFIALALEFIQEFWKEHGEKIIATVTQLWEGIQSVIQSITEIISTIIQAVLQFVMEIWEKHGEQIIKTVTAIWNMIVTVIQSVITIVVGVFKAFAALLKGDWSALGEALKSIWNALWTAIKAVFQAAKQVLITAFGVAKTVLSNIWEALKKSLTDIWNKAWDAIKAAVDNAKAAVIGKINSIIDSIKRAFSIDWGSLGKSIIDGIISGLSSGLGRIISKAKQIARNALSAAKKALGIGSPSREFMKIGRQMTEGIAVGLSQTSNVERAIDRLAGVAETSMRDRALGIKGTRRAITNTLNIYTNAPVEADVPDLLLLRAWVSG